MHCKNLQVVHIFILNFHYVWVTYRFLQATCHNDTRGWRGLSLMVFWNSEKLSNFKVPELFMNCHELSWIVNELCTCLIINEKRSSNFYKISKKNCEINQLLKLWGLILRVLSSWPALAHVYRWTLKNSSFFRL